MMDMRAQGHQSMKSGLEGHHCYRCSLRRSDLFRHHALAFRQSSVITGATRLSNGEADQFKPWAHAATERYSVPVRQTCHTMRMSLLARATAALLWPTRVSR